jgi:hypothetical protein
MHATFGLPKATKRAPILRNVHDQARAHNLLKNRPSVDLRQVKDLLNDFANERAKLPHSQLEREFGDLLLYLVRLAERLEVDLIGAGQRQIDRLAAISSVLVPRHFPATTKPDKP